MEIRIKKNGTCNEVECYLNFCRNTGEEMRWNDEGKIYYISNGNFDNTVMNFLGINDKKVSRKFIEYAKKIAVDKGDYFEVLVNESDFVYSMHKGIKYGFPEKEVKGLFLEYPKIKFLPDSGMYYYEDFGNQFNGGSTIHASDEFVVESLADMQGNQYETSYSSPGHIDGWGSGFKGGFYIVQKQTTK